ncbi:MAG: hypothetical protein RL641_336 [Candidatus Parcubacteria bacterium]
MFELLLESLLDSSPKDRRLSRYFVTKYSAISPIVAESNNINGLSIWYMKLSILAVYILVIIIIVFYICVFCILTVKHEKSIFLFVLPQNMLDFWQIILK